MKTARNVQVRYNVEVDHEPREFKKEMDLLKSNPAEAYSHYKRMKEKYGADKVHITKITTTTVKERISESDLLKLTKD